MNIFALVNVKQVVKGWMEAIWAWLVDFFNPELSGYTNFDFGSGEMLNIKIIIFGIFGGVLLASLYMIYVKNVVGAFVRKLLAEGCLSEDRAKTLEELGFIKNPFVRLALRGSLLASTVMHVQPREGSAEADGDAAPSVETQGDVSSENQENFDVSKTEEAGKGAADIKKAKDDPRLVRYYIKEEKKYVAEMRFNNRGSGWPTFFFVLLVSVICVFLIFWLLPAIMRFLDNTISIFSVAGNTVK